MGPLPFAAPCLSHIPTVTAYPKDILRFQTPHFPSEIAIHVFPNIRLTKMLAKFSRVQFWGRKNIFQVAKWHRPRPQKVGSSRNTASQENQPCVWYLSCKMDQTDPKWPFNLQTVSWWQRHVVKSQILMVVEVPPFDAKYPIDHVSIHLCLKKWGLFETSQLWLIDGLLSKRKTTMNYVLKRPNHPAWCVDMPISTTLVWKVTSSKHSWVRPFVALFLHTVSVGINESNAYRGIHHLWPAPFLSFLNKFMSPAFRLNFT